MKAPFKISNIIPGVTEIKNVSYGSGYFHKHKHYPVRKVMTNSILTIDEYGKDHTLTLDYLNQHCELVNADYGTHDLVQVLHNKVTNKDLKGMDEAYKALRDFVVASLPKVYPLDIRGGAAFKSPHYYVLIIELPEQGFKYMRTSHDERIWAIPSVTWNAKNLAEHLEKLQFQLIKEIPTL